MKNLLHSFFLFLDYTANGCYNDSNHSIVESIQIYREVLHMRAGFAEREYTPAEGIVPGQIEVNYAVGQRTPLMAHVAIIESQNIGTVLVSLDILFASTAFITKLRNRIRQITGISVERILIACTHTHTGCAIDCDVWAFRGDPSYMTEIEEQTIAAVTTAWENLEEVQLGTATGYDARFNFCRDWYTTDGYIVMNPGFKHRDKLVKPYAAVDHTVNVMRVDDLQGKPKCLIVNYANHLDTTQATDGMKFGADYAGYLRRALQKEYGEDVTVLFLNGCCANVNHYDYGNHYCRGAHCRPNVIPAEEIGNGLAETVKNICPPPVTHAADIRIEGISRKQLISRRKATRAHKEWALKTQEAIRAGKDVHTRERILVDTYLNEDPSIPNTMDIEISVLQIGDWVIVGLPGEIYSDIGLKIKANSPFANTVIVEIANGYHGYISPDIIQRAGNYEGIYSTVAYTGLGSADALINGATDMLYALYYADNQASLGGLRDKPLD